MKLKIVSDGTVTGTHLVCADTGVRVELIQELVWTVSTDQGFASYGSIRQHSYGGDEHSRQTRSSGTGFLYGSI